MPAPDGHVDGIQTEALVSTFLLKEIRGSLVFLCQHFVLFCY